MKCKKKHTYHKRKYKNNEFAFDIVLSMGKNCRPAHYLQKHRLKFYTNPLDWMGLYSLDTIIHLHQTKFNDFFVDFVRDEQNPHSFFDVKNNIRSTHYENIEKHNETFREVVKCKFEKTNKKLMNASKICFISNRDEDISVLSNFLKEMGNMYSGKITYMNIRNNEEIDGIILPVKYKKEKISKKLEFIEYEFNDVYPNINGMPKHPDSWRGNIHLWDSIVEKISIRKNFLTFINER
jgi:hypothetical protein